MAAANRFLCAEIEGDSLSLTVVDATGTECGHLVRNLAGKTGSNQDPQDWWRAMRTGVKDLLRRNSIPAGSIRGVGLSGTLERVICIDENGVASCPTCDLGPADLQEATAAIVERCGAGNLCNITGQSPAPTSMAAHLLWIQRNAKRVWHDARHVLHDRDFLRFRLTGVAATDPSCAAPSLLFNVR
ncbi:MAG: FGGY family carbohydrate kinase, partial [Planctomycetota bacterium]